MSDDRREALRHDEAIDRLVRWHEAMRIAGLLQIGFAVVVACTLGIGWGLLALGLVRLLDLADAMLIRRARWHLAKMKAHVEGAE